MVIRLKNINIDDSNIELTEFGSDEEQDKPLLKKREM